VLSEHPAPVETRAAETIRQLGLKHLGARYATLLNRSARRALLASEKDELAATERALEQLHAMRPVGPLLTRKRGAWLQEEESERELPV
jgi:hypothetical protein